MRKLQFKNYGLEVKEIREENFSIDFIFSTADEDRQGEVVDQKGWILDEYIKNPVFLFSHDPYQPAIGKCTEIKIVNGNLEGTIQFAAAEYEFARTIFNLYKGGYMRAVSVGFRNNLYEVDEDEEQIVLRENTLYEISAVNIPANAMALAKSKGIDIKALEEYDNMPKIEKKLTPGEQIAKAAAAIQKEGRVLSSKNRGIIEDAVTALKDILAADDNSGKNMSQADTKKAQIKGVQIRPKADSQNPDGKLRFTKAQLNRAISGLLTAKKTISVK